MSKSTRVGLSEYTARRLAELRARRAEADDNGAFSASSVSLSVSHDTSGLPNGDESSYRNSVADIQLSSNNQKTNASIDSENSAIPTGSTSSEQSTQPDSPLRMCSSLDAESGSGLSPGDGSLVASSGVEHSLPTSCSVTEPKSSSVASIGPPVAFEAVTAERSTGSIGSSVSSEERISVSSSVRALESEQRTFANGLVLRSSSGLSKNSTDNTSRRSSSGQHIPETAASQLASGIQKTPSFGSYRDTNTNVTHRAVTVGQRGVESKLPSQAVLSSPGQHSLSTSSLSPRPAPAVCAKPTAAAISMALSASARPASEADCIGFASLPDQLHRKAAKRGFDFTVMVVGETGLGKSTLLSNLFCKFDLYNDRDQPDLLAVNKTVKLEKRTLEIEDRGIKLRLTVVDTPGFGDLIDSTNCWQLIENYIDEQFEHYFNDETGLNRHNIKDSRVHCCLYFVSPYGRGLRPIDIQCMQRLQSRVNLIPVISKADTLTPAETKRLKAAILKDIKANGIQTYEMPPCDDEDDDEYKAKDQEMKDSWPFAVIGANCVVDVGGRKVRGRAYPWGFVEAENVLHSDFTKLQQFLISTQLQDLKEVTCDVHYENFRINRLKQDRNTTNESAKGSSQKVVDTESLLRLKEDEIRRMQQMMSQMQAQLSSGGQH